MIGHDPVAEMLHGNGRERRLSTRLPHGDVAAHRGQCGVPRPDRDGEIEGGDDADHAQRMPLFAHAVTRPLAGDHQSVQLAGKPDGEIADVYHLLDFPHALDADLAHFQGNELAQRFLVFAQDIAEVPHHVAPLRRRGHPPCVEGPSGVFDHPVVDLGRRLPNARDRFVRGRVVRREDRTLSVYPAVHPRTGAVIDRFDMQSFKQCLHLRCSSVVSV